MEKDDDPLLSWFYGRSKTERRGNLQRFPRADEGIYTYSHRYRLEGEKKSQSFYLNPNHTDDLEIAKTVIRKIENEIRLAKNARLLGLKIPTSAEKKESALTLIELLKWHLEEILTLGRATRTARNYEEAFLKFIEWAGGENVLVRSLQLRQLYEYYSFLRKNGNSIISATTRVRLIRYVLSHAKQKQLIAQSPFADYRDETIPDSPPRDLLTPAEMKKIAEMILASQRRYRRQLWLAWQFGRFTGMRGSDILRLKCEDIDHKNRALTFYMVKRKKNPWVTIPLHWKLAKILRKLEGRTGKIFSFSGGEINERILLWNFRYFIAELKGPGFKRKGTHTLRHSFNHILEQQDVRYEYQCYLLGHILRMGGEHKKYMHPETSEMFKKLREVVDALPL